MRLEELSPFAGDPTSGVISPLLTDRTSRAFIVQQTSIARDAILRIQNSCLLNESASALTDLGRLVGDAIDRVERIKDEKAD